MYQRMEKVYFAAWILSGFLFFFPPKGFPKINTVYTVSFSLLFITVLTTLAIDNFISYTSVLKKMKEWHKAEYNRHKAKLYADFLIIQILLAALFIYGTLNMWNTACEVKMSHF